MEKKGDLIVSTSPQIKSGESVAKTMYMVLIALIPATAASIFFFGVKAIYMVLVV